MEKRGNRAIFVRGFERHNIFHVAISAQGEKLCALLRFRRRERLRERKAHGQGTSERCRWNQAGRRGIITGGRIVNVYTGEIYDGGVAISNQTIAAVGDVDYCIGEGTRTIDAEGAFITPGFIDGHIHPESSDLAIRPFAEAVLKHGTTSIMTDLHEVGVVSGLPGIEAVLAENEITDLNLYFVVPSHVPFSPALETSGGKFNPEIIREALKRPDAVGISECVGPYVLAELPDLLESLDDVASMKGMTAQGHLVEMKGKDLNKCVTAGISTCHEALSADDIMDRARAGVHAMLRVSPLPLAPSPTS